jgi:hypothetical protein
MERRVSALFAFIFCCVLITDYIMSLQWLVNTWPVWHFFFFFHSDVGSRFRRCGSGPAFFRAAFSWDACRAETPLPDCQAGRSQDCLEIGISFVTSASRMLYTRGYGGKD